MKDAAMSTFPEDSLRSDLPSEKPKRSCFVTCLIVFVIGSILFVLVGAGIAWYVYSNRHDIGANLASVAIKSVVEQSDMSPEDKRAVLEQTDRVVEAFREKRIDLTDIERIFKQLSESPLFQVVIIKAVDSAYVKKSGLTDEEKAAATLTLQRIGRGLFEESIEMEDIEAAIDTIAVKGPQGEQQLKPPEQVSDEELRKMLAELKQVADENEVPNEPFDVDIAEEFKRVVDDALGE